jgi:hypothetical protein
VQFAAFHTWGAQNFRWLLHFWKIYALLALIIITVTIATRKAYFYGEVKPGFPACCYAFSESVTKNNETSYFIKGDKFIDQDKYS